MALPRTVMSLQFQPRVMTGPFHTPDKQWLAQTTVRIASKGLECFRSLSLEGRHKQQKENTLECRRPLLGWASCELVNVSAQSLATWIWKVYRARRECWSCVTLGKYWSSLSLISLHCTLIHRGFLWERTWMAFVEHLAQCLAHRSSCF